MQLNIISPDRSLFSGEAQGVKVPGKKGSFEVLENHAPLVSSLDSGTVRVNTTEGEKNFDITGGVIEVSNNVVVVLVG